MSFAWIVLYIGIRVLSIPLETSYNDECSGIAIIRSIQAGNYEVAEEVATRLRIKLADDPDSLFKEKEKPKPFFRAVVKQWLEVARDSCKESSVERFEQVCRDYIADAIGGERLDQIERKTIMDILLICASRGFAGHRSILSAAAFPNLFNLPLGKI